MKLGLSTLSIALILLMILGCRKKDTAGTGGDYTMVVNMKHHTLAVDSGQVYIKYNASDAPTSLASYENSEELSENSDGSTQATFSGLKKGEYYLYGNGWDQTIFSTVEGGLPYEIKSGDKIIEINLQVTEDGH